MAFDEEISRQMIEAGVSRAKELDGLTSSAYLVEEVFRAMLAQSPCKKCTSAQ
jgi:hypothetical protein